MNKYEVLEEEWGGEATFQSPTESPGQSPTREPQPEGYQGDRGGVWHTGTLTHRTGTSPPTPNPTDGDRDTQVITGANRTGRDINIYYLTTVLLNNNSDICSVCIGHVNNKMELEFRY